MTTFSDPSERAKAALKIPCPSCKTEAGEYCLDTTKTDNKIGIQPIELHVLPIRYICQGRLDQTAKELDIGGMPQ
jgi:hypothetical protein